MSENIKRVPENISRKTQFSLSAEKSKFHPEQIGPYATREKLGAQVEAELDSLFQLMTVHEIDHQKEGKIREINQEILQGFNEGIHLQEKAEQPLSEEEKRVVNLKANNTPAHDKAHSQKVLLGTIAVCKRLVAEGALITAGGEKIKAETAKISSLIQNMLTAAILHDIGYFSRQGESLPNGACFALLHEKRSMEFAQIYLAQKGWEEAEIREIMALIHGTDMSVKYEEEYENPLLRQAAKFLHLTDLAAYFCSHDADTVDGEEEVSRLLLNLYREFSYPQIQIRKGTEYEFLTLNGTPEEDDRFEWKLSKNKQGFGPDPLSFIINPFIGSPGVKAEMEELFLFLDQKGQPNPYREGYKTTLRRQEAIRIIHQLPELIRGEKAPELSDAVYFEGFISENTWIATLQERGLLPAPPETDLTEVEKRQIWGERLKIRTQIAGVEAHTQEPSLANLIERLPTTLIQEKLAEIASKPYPNREKAREEQISFLRTLFEKAALSAFREGIRNLEIRFAAQAYSQEVKDKLQPGLKERALSLIEVAAAAELGIKKAISTMKERGIETGKESIPPDPKTKASLILLLRLKRDLPDSGEEETKLIKKIKSLHESGVISGVSFAGSDTPLLNPNQRKQILSFASKLKQEREELPLEFHLGEEAVEAEQTKRYQEAAREIAFFATRIATGIGLSSFYDQVRQMPLVFSPFTLHQIGIPLKEILRTIESIYKKGEGRNNIFITSGNARSETPSSLSIQLVMLFEKLSGKRIEELFPSDDPETIKQGLNIFTDFLKSLTPNIKRVLFTP